MASHSVAENVQLRDRRWQNIDSHCADEQFHQRDADFAPPQSQAVATTNIR